MASFLNRLVGGVERVLGVNQKPTKQAIPPPPPPRINIQHLNQALGPSFNSFHNLQAAPPPPPPLNPAIRAAPIAPEYSHAVKNAFVQTAQAVPRGVVNLSLSGAQLIPGFHVPGTVAPTNRFTKDVLGSNAQSVQQSYKENKNKRGALAAIPFAAGSLASDLPGVPGKKQVAEKAGELAKEVKLSPALLNKEVLPGVKGVAGEAGKGKVRQFPETVRNAPQTSPSFAKTIKQMPLETRPNSQTLSRAVKEINADPAKALNEAMQLGNKKSISDHDQAKALVLVNHLIQNDQGELANQLIESVAKSRTEIARALQIGAAYARTTPTGVYKYAKELGAEDTAAKGFFDRAGEIAKIKDKDQQGLERFKLLEDVARLQPSGGAQKAVDLWRAGLLTAPTTSAGNILSNVIESGTKQGLVNPVATAIDKATSLFTGKRSRTLGIKGVISGTAEGLKKGEKYLETGYDPRNPASKYETGRTIYGNSPGGRAAHGYTQGVYRFLGAQDQPFYYANLRQSLGDLAKTEAINQKIPRGDRQKFVENFLANPPQNALEQASEDARRAVFGNQTILGSVAGLLKQPHSLSIAGKKVPYSGAGAQFLIPFSQVPSSIATRILERSPLGFARAGKQIYNGVKNGDFDQRSFTEALANATVGTGGALIVGKELANNGLITLGYPTDPKEKELWKEQGKQPYSVKLGNKWLSLNYVQPFGSILAYGAAYSQARNQKQSVENAAAQAVGQAAKSVTSQSFLQGVSGALQAVQKPDEAAAQLFENTAGSLIPNLVKSFARSTDPQQRDIKGIKQAVQGGIPGQREKLPSLNDAFGNPLPRQSSATNSLFNPLRPSDVRGNSTSTELQRLSDAGQGIVPTSIKSNSLGANTALNPKQQRDLQTIYGQALQPTWQKIMQDPRYQKLSDENKMKALRTASENVLDAAKATYASSNNLAVPKNLSTASKLILQGKSVDLLAKTSGQLTPADKYKNALDTYNANKSTYTDAKNIKEQASLSKLKIGADYSQDVIDLYGLNKTQIYNYITNSPKGQDLSSKLKSYDDALYKSGLISTPKFKTGFAPKIGSSGGSSGSSLKVKLPPKPKAVKIGKAPSPKAKIAKLKFQTPKLAKVKKSKVQLSKIS